MNGRWRRAIMAGAGLAAIGAGPLPQTQTAPQCRDGQSRWITVRNLTPNVVMNIYERRSGTSEWGKDKLGDVALPPGAQVRMAMSSEACRCSGDVRVRYEGDRRPERTTWNFYYCSGTRVLDAQ